MTSPEGEYLHKPFLSHFGGTHQWRLPFLVHRGTVEFPAGCIHSSILARVSRADFQMWPACGKIAHHQVFEFFSSFLTLVFLEASCLIILLKTFAAAALFFLAGSFSFLKLFGDTCLTYGPCILFCNQENLVL